MKILLIGNYLNDQQQSMQRFSKTLFEGLLVKGHDVRLVRPKLYCGLLKRSPTGTGKWLGYISKVFGGLLILMGILVFTNQLSRIAAIPYLTELLQMISSTAPGTAMSLGLGVAFIAGLASFLSPCVLPLIPAFLSYLASTVTKK